MIRRSLTTFRDLPRDTFSDFHQGYYNLFKSRHGIISYLIYAAYAIVVLQSEREANLYIK